MPHRLVIVDKNLLLVAWFSKLCHNISAAGCLVFKIMSQHTKLGAIKLAMALSLEHAVTLVCLLPFICVRNT